MNSTTKFNHNKKKRIIEIMGGKCAICGYDKCIAALEMHHIDMEEKEFSFSKASHYISIKDMESEMKKCILLCSNCHKEVHYGGVEINLVSSFDEKIYNTIISEMKNRTGNFCAECGKKINYRAVLCNSCSRVKRRKVERPSRDDLKKLIREYPFERIAKYFGVTDNAIREWCKKYNLPSRKKDILNMSEIQWNKI